MNENPLLAIVQELRSKELNSLDQIPAINKKLNLLIINCLYSLLCLFRDLEQSHLNSPDGKPDLSRMNKPQLLFVSNMLRDDIKVIKEFIDITYKEYIQNNRKIIKIGFLENSENLLISFPYIAMIRFNVLSNSKIKFNPFATETEKRSDKIFSFYSQIIERIIGVQDLNKDKPIFTTLSKLNLEEEEFSIRTALAPILDSIEKFIKLFNNHIHISKIK